MTGLSYYDEDDENPQVQPFSDYDEDDEDSQVQSEILVAISERELVVIIEGP